MKFVIEEEYGYRWWVWETNKTYPEMIEWWTGLETVSPYFFNPGKSLPFGNVILMSDSLSELKTLDEEGVRGYIHLHCDEDSYMKIDKETFHHKGYCPYDFQK
jgi:hypothetical protein